MGMGIKSLKWEGFCTEIYSRTPLPQRAPYCMWRSAILLKRRGSNGNISAPTAKRFWWLRRTNLHVRMHLASTLLFFTKTNSTVKFILQGISGRQKHYSVPKNAKSLMRRHLATVCTRSTQFSPKRSEINW